MPERLIDTHVDQLLHYQGWCHVPGAYVIVDGQFGSTGKGVAAALVAAYAWSNSAPLDYIVSNAGPNSGHTARLRGPNGNDLVWINKQVPIATSVLDHLAGSDPEALLPWTLLNSGAIVDVERLRTEVATLHYPERLWVHAHAAVVLPEHREANQEQVAGIASTGQGTGPAAAARMARRGLESVYQGQREKPEGALLPRPYLMGTFNLNDPRAVSLIETSQGFSLGIGAGFYPHCTHRECTVAQALADAYIAPQSLRRVMMVVRTYPIRVGNTTNTSGPGYPDQQEIGWDMIGQDPELTTVTRRERRLFTWSQQQFVRACEVNQPDVVLLNFMNYLAPDQQQDFALKVYRTLQEIVPDGRLLLGYGPRIDQVHVYGRGVA